MAESRYVLYGLIAGAASGVAAGVAVFLTMPTVDEVLEYIESYVDVHGIAEEALRSYLAIALKLSPFIVFVFSLFLGALFGAVYEFIDKRAPWPAALSALLAGLAYAAILIVPNMLLGAGWQEILVNTAGTLSYTVVLVTLTMHEPPGP